MTRAQSMNRLSALRALAGRIPASHQLARALGGALHLITDLLQFAFSKSHAGLIKNLELVSPKTI
jgi:hypothetical protein